MWEPNNIFYITVVCQVLVTLILVPRLIKSNLLKSFAPYIKEQNEELKISLEKLLTKVIKQYVILCNFISLVCLGFIAKAWYEQTELLNWDNQASIVLLSFIASGSILYISYGLHQCRKLTMQFSKGVRKASLTVRRWQDYIPVNLALMVVLSQIALICSVFYFMAHPFDGFAGAGNFIGIAVLNCIFIFCIVNLLTKNSWPVGITQQQKHVTKLRGVSISLVVWLLAGIYLLMSMHLDASSAKDIALLSKSVYFTILFLVGTRFYELPDRTDYR